MRSLKIAPGTLKNLRGRCYTAVVVVVVGRDVSSASDLSLAAFFFFFFLLRYDYVAGELPVCARVARLEHFCKRRRGFVYLRRC